jgi:hypothetical protein
MPLLREFRGFAFESTRRPAVATALSVNKAEVGFVWIDELRVAAVGLKESHASSRLSPWLRRTC